MKQFSNYDEAKKNAQFTGSEKLPAGAYVCEIKNVQYKNGENGNSDLINILFDICEGEYKDFYKKQYDGSTDENKKWKGRASIWVPSDDGSEKDGWTKNSFAKWTNAFEASNKGYVWDWDENKWKSKKIGLVFREEGNVIEGKEILYTTVAFPIEVQKVRDGKAPEAKFKARNGYTGRSQVQNNRKSNSTEASIDDFMTIPTGTEEEIPFD